MWLIQLILGSVLAVASLILVLLFYMLFGFWWAAVAVLASVISAACSVNSRK
jgi:hypothetical protein